MTNEKLLKERLGKAYRARRKEIERRLAALRLQERGLDSRRRALEVERYYVERQIQSLMNEIKNIDRMLED
ncbi:MAG: hypothetical protein AB1742_13505 [bacterium]